MSKTKVTLLIASGIGILFFGCLLTGMALWMFSSRPARPVETLTPEQMQAYRIEIEKIAPQINQLKADTFDKEAGKTPAERRADLVSVLQKYDDGLFKIDVSNCPPDFQAAYLELIRSLEATKTFATVHDGGVDDALALASDGVWATIGNVGKLSQEGKAVSAKLNDAESELRLAAKKYNAKGY